MNIDVLCEALNMKARSSTKFMKVSSAKVSGKDVFRVRSINLASNSTMVRERIRIDRVVGKIVFQPFSRNTGVAMAGSKLFPFEYTDFHLEYLWRLAIHGRIG